MIITKLRLQENHPMVGATVSWPLPVCDFNLNSTAGENGYILKEVEGLGPPELIAIVEGFDVSGTPIMGNAAPKRDIVLKIGLSPRLGQSYSTLRDSLYRYVSRTVLVGLMNDSMIIAQTAGYIRHVEPVLFSNKPEIQITIECEDGDFAAPDPINIPFSDITTNQPVINYEDGTAPTGLDLQFTYINDAVGSGFTIFNHSEFWFAGEFGVYNEFRINYPFIKNDIITISTQSKEQRITLLRDLDEYDLSGYINGGAVWPKLYPGVNTFEWTFDSSWMTWLSATYFPRYWGV